LQRFGPNALPPGQPRSLLARIKAQLTSALIYLLLLALVVDLTAWVISGAAGVPLEALAILGVVLLNATLGVLQEYRSERALLELRRLSAPRTWVLRDGAFEHLDAADIVPGDLVRLEAGDRVPADGVAREPQSLRLDESVLTGESLPVDKVAGDELLSGSLVAHGFGLLEVERTGPESNMGKLAATLGSIETLRTPLEQRVDQLGRTIARAVGVICLLLVAGGFALEGFSHPVPIVMFAVAFGVAVVPEGMPTMMTLALALGVQRMARRKAVVRRLAAVEALGSVTVVATDKTGTLTQNRLVVEHVDTVSGRAGDALCAMVLANDADAGSGAGDPLELALMHHAEQHGADVASLRQAYPRISSRGFDSRWRCMRATVISPAGEQLSFLKGAPEAILQRSRLDDAQRAHWLAQAERAAGQGLKVLGLAKSEAEAEHDLTFLGLVSLWDAPRPEAQAAVRAARRAGMRVVMITGDHPATARSVAAAVGIDADTVLIGDQLAKSDGAIDQQLKQGCVFARMQPDHKLRLIERLQAQGEIVAMTGDGLNDAPALKRADVGIAMGERGSEVAREVADLVLLDDNFATIVAAVEEGRGIYTNIQNFIRFSFSSNVALLILVLGGALGSLLLGLRDEAGSLLLPLSALQILWINFLGDGPPALALALDRSKSALLERPRAPKAPLLSGVSTRFVIGDGLLKGGVGLSLLVLLPIIGLGSAATASAVFLYEGVAKLLSMFPARRLSAELRHNSWILGAAVASVVLQLACVSVPVLRDLLDLTALGTLPLVVVGAALLATYLLGDLLRYLLRSTSSRSEPAGRLT
jgi:Ca2+-transporting ATPase